MRRVGSFEAKTHFSRLIDDVVQGETILITRKGKPVAELRPARGLETIPPDKAIDQLFSIDARLGISVRRLIEEGRRH